MNNGDDAKDELRDYKVAYRSEKNTDLFILEYNLLWSDKNALIDASHIERILRLKLKWDWLVFNLTINSSFNRTPRHAWLFYEELSEKK